MLSKKKASKYQHAAGAAVDDDGGSVTTRIDALLSIVQGMKVNSRDHVVVPRPAHSRIVNHTSLRPHGALHEGELEICLQLDTPPESLLHDIVSMVNGSQILLRRCPDFLLVADSKQAIKVLHHRSFRHWWLDSVAQDCACGAMYPFTGFYFAANASENSLNPEASYGKVESCTSTGEVIRDILLVFNEMSNEPRWAFKELLFHAIRNEKNSVEGLLEANYNSQHITVCCGLYFYRVDVLDEDGLVASADTIAKRLQAVKEHADRTERALRQQTLLPESLEDILGFYQLLGRMTEIDREACSHVMERLENANPVNAAALTTIDAGIFAVVLRCLDRKASSAHWYRSAMVLEETETDGLLKLRAHSTLLHGDELMDFLLNIFRINGGHGVLSKPEEGVPPVGQRAGEEEKEEEKKEEAPTAGGDQLTGVEHMEMWLPWKHRKPMQPYAAVHPPPSIFSLHVSDETFISFACLCTSAVLAVQQVLTPRGGLPTVLVAFSNPRGGVSASLLYSREIEALIQCMRSGSALVERRTMKHLVIVALQSVARVADACFGEPYPMYSMAKILLATKKAAAPDAVADGGVLGAVDLYITANMLGSSGRVIQCETSLVLPSRFAITCSTAGSLKQQQQQQPSSTKGPSSAQVTRASLMELKTEGHESLGARLAECILETARQLLSLLSM